LLSIAQCFEDGDGACQVSDFLAVDFVGRHNGLWSLFTYVYIIRPM
jgi:hypothetical protein